MHFTFKGVKLSVFQKVLNFRSNHFTVKVCSIVNNSSNKVVIQFFYIFEELIKTIQALINVTR